jgi:hypothetical protein
VLGMTLPLLDQVIGVMEAHSWASELRTIERCACFFSTAQKYGQYSARMRLGTRSRWTMQYLDHQLPATVATGGGRRIAATRSK